MCNFCELTKGYTLPTSLSSYFVGLCAALAVTPKFFFPSTTFCINALLILAAVILLHLAGNLYDDYIDVMAYVKKGVPLNEINFETKAKARLILNGTYSLDAVRNILIIMLTVAFLIGAYFIWLRGSFFIERGLIILGYMVLTVVLAMLYPNSSKKGFAEVIIATIFGPLLVCGTYFALVGRHNLTVYVLSLVVGIMITVLHTAHSIMDYEYDLPKGKKTLPVLLQSKSKAISFILIFVLLGYAIVAYAKITYYLSPMFYLPILFSLPVLIKLVKSLHDYIEVKDVKLEPKWYYGAMEGWNKIVNSGAQYFMYRFYLARNLGIIFNITLGLCFLFAYDPFYNVMFRMFDMWGF